MGAIQNEHETRYIRVETINLDTGELESVRTIDHNIKADRVWPGKHCYGPSVTAGKSLPGLWTRPLD